MSTRFAGASLIAVLFLAGAPAAMAADLSGDPYDDPRYADVYRDGPPPQSKRYVERYEERRYEERDHSSYKDSGYDEGSGYDKGSRYGGRDDGYDRGDRYDRGYGYGRDRRDRCVPRHLIRHELKEQGWHGFHALQVRNNVVLLKARRPSGRVFDLKVDRCTGHIVHAKACDGADYGRYASDPRRHYRY